MNQVKNIQLNEQSVSTIGNIDLLKRNKQGLLCSRKCPADKILEANDRFKEWAANSDMAVISGFHSPVEKECLRRLLKGQAGIIVCPARNLESMRIPGEWKPALEAGRMLILSSFKEKRADVHTTEQRNQFVAALSNDLYIPYANPGGRIERIMGKFVRGDLFS